MRSGSTCLNRGLLRVCTVLFEMQQILSSIFKGSCEYFCKLHAAAPLNYNEFYLRD